MVRRDAMSVSSTEERTEKREATSGEGGGAGREGSTCWNTPELTEEKK